MYLQNVPIASNKFTFCPSFVVSMFMEARKIVPVGMPSARDVLLPVHMKARTSPYSRSDVNRTYVQDDKVYWQVQ